MSEYLFRRARLFGGEGLVQSSTIFTAKGLLQKVPFRAESRTHDDIDWLLRAGMCDDTAVQCVTTPEPLAIWHREEHLQTISILLTWVSANAIEQGDRSAFWLLVKEACRNGTPSILDGIVGLWLIPEGLGRWSASCLSAARHRRARHPTEDQRQANMIEGKL